LVVVKNIETKSDKELLQEYKITGDKQVIGEFYRRYMKFTFFICLKYLQNSEQSEEAVMQIFEKLFEDLKRFDIDNFKPWLHSVARNHCMLMHRANSYAIKRNEELKKDSTVFMESDDDLYLDTEKDNEMKLKFMKECLEILKLQQKECIQYFYIEQKCYQEVSEITGYNMKKVKSYIQNGKRNLKNCIEGKYEQRA